MASLTTATYSHALKRLYPQSVIESLVYDGAGPLWAKVAKTTDFGGAAKAITCLYTPTLGRSATFATAQANKGPSKGVQFLVTRVKDYSLYEMDTEVIFASENNSQSLLRATKEQMESATLALGRSIGQSLYGNGSGQVGSIISTQNLALTALTLSNKEDVTNFEVGDIVVFAANDTSALRNSGAKLTVNAVDRNDGILTMSAALNTVTGIAASDAIFKQGDYVSASDRLKMTGLAGWIPSTDPTTGDSHFGVDRSVDPSRLAGIRVDGTSMQMDEAIQKCASVLAREGARPDCVVMDFAQFNALQNILGSKAEYTDFKVGEIAFAGIRVNGPKGPLDVFPDENCPNTVAYVLTTKSWEFSSAGPCPRWLDADGNKILRMASSDSVEGRLGFYGQLFTPKPGHNGRVSLTATT